MPSVAGPHVGRPYADWDSLCFNAQCGALQPVVMRRIRRIGDSRRGQQLPLSTLSDSAMCNCCAPTSMIPWHSVPVGSFAYCCLATPLATIRSVRIRRNSLLPSTSTNDTATGPPGVCALTELGRRVLAAETARLRAAAGSRTLCGGYAMSALVLSLRAIYRLLIGFYPRVSRRVWAGDAGNLRRAARRYGPAWRRRAADCGRARAGWAGARMALTPVQHVLNSATLLLFGLLGGLYTMLDLYDV
jgi:hypothetical protein